MSSAAGDAIVPIIKTRHGWGYFIPDKPNIQLTVQKVLEKIPFLMSDYVNLAL